MEAQQPPKVKEAAWLAGPSQGDDPLIFYGMGTKINKLTVSGSGIPNEILGKYEKSSVSLINCTSRARVRLCRAHSLLINPNVP